MINLSAIHTSTPIDYGSPQQAREDGWLGQVPPPSVPAPTPTEPEPPTYAIPQLAPEPWKSDPPLWGADPTLFG